MRNYTPPKFCMHCGAPVGAQGARFCLICGKSLYATDRVYYEDYRKAPRSCVPANPDTVKYPAIMALVMPVLAFLFLTAITVGIGILAIFMLPSLSLDFIYSMEFTILGLFLELLFIVPPFLYLRKYFPPPSTKLRFQVFGLPLGREKAKKLWLEVLIGLGVGFGMVFLVTGIQWLSEGLWEAIFGSNFVSTGINGLGETQTGIFSGNPGQLVLIWVAMFGTVGLGEEILYRGFTQRGLVQSWGKGAGILITAMLFTLAHILPGIVPVQTFVVFFFPYFAISLLLGFMREWRKGNLLACIIAHGFYNSLIITIAFMGV